MAQTITYTNEKETQMPASPKRLARIAGVLYLFVGIFGGFAEGFVEPRMYAAGNAATTAGNVVANAGLVRLGVVSDLLDQTIWIFLGLTLDLLLKHVNKSVAMAMVVLVAIGAGITCLNTVFEFEGLRVATGAVNLAAFGAAGSNALVLLLLDTQHYGIFIAQIFFGLWLIPLGYLAYNQQGGFPSGWASCSSWRCLLPRGLVRAVPGSRLWQEIHSFIWIPSHSRRSRWSLPARDRCEDSKPDERIPAPSS